MHEVLDIGLDFSLDEYRGDACLQYVETDVLRRNFSEPLPVGPATLEKMISEFRRVARYSIAQMSPRYVAFPDSGNSVASLAAAVLAPLLNQNMISMERGAPAGTFIEVQTLEWLRQVVGYDFRTLDGYRSAGDLGGLVTSGGQMSNHISLLLALNERYPVFRRSGLRGINVAPRVLLAGDLTHYSFLTAVHALGLGADAIVSLPANEKSRLDVHSLDASIDSLNQDEEAFIVVGVAGNTKTSQFDDLRSINRWAKSRGLWFHVDACHGGSLIFSHKYRYLLEGIEEADSIALDPHKGLFLPYPLSVLLVKDRGVLARLSRKPDAAARDGSLDLGQVTPFSGSRGLEVMKLWSVIKMLGSNGLGEVVDSRQELAEFAYSQVANSELFCVFHDFEFYRICFNFFPQSLRGACAATMKSSQFKAVVDDLTAVLSKRAYEDGVFCFDSFPLLDIENRTGLGSKERFEVLSMTIGNPAMERQSVIEAIGYLSQLARTLLPMYQSRWEAAESEIMTGTADPVSRNQGGPAGWN